MNKVVDKKYIELDLNTKVTIDTRIDQLNKLKEEFGGDSYLILDSGYNSITVEVEFLRDPTPAELLAIENKKRKKILALEKQKKNLDEQKKNLDEQIKTLLRDINNEPSGT